MNRAPFGPNGPFQTTERDRYLGEMDRQQASGWASFGPQGHSCAKGGPCLCKKGQADQAGGCGCKAAGARQPEATSLRPPAACGQQLRIDPLVRLAAPSDLADLAPLRTQTPAQRRAQAMAPAGRAPVRGPVRLHGSAAKSRPMANCPMQPSAASATAPRRSKPIPPQSQTPVPNNSAAPRDFSRPWRGRQARADGRQRGDAEWAFGAFFGAAGRSPAQDYFPGCPDVCLGKNCGAIPYLYGYDELGKAIWLLCTCGTCGPDVPCEQNKCAWPVPNQPPNWPTLPTPACAADCKGRICGPDGCNGSCGQCDWLTQTCDDKGQCIPKFVIPADPPKPDCAKACVNSACGWADNGCFCGKCLQNMDCVLGECIHQTACEKACKDKTCGAFGECPSCGNCPPDTLCVNGECVPVQPGCDKICQGGCGLIGECICGKCPVVQVGPFQIWTEQCCDNGLCKICNKDDSKDCGDDGCCDDNGPCPAGVTCGPDKMCVLPPADAQKKAALVISLQQIWAKWNDCGGEEIVVFPDVADLGNLKEYNFYQAKGVVLPFDQLDCAAIESQLYQYLKFLMQKVDTLAGWSKCGEYFVNLMKLDGGSGKWLADFTASCGGANCQNGPPCNLPNSKWCKNLPPNPTPADWVKWGKCGQALFGDLAEPGCTKKWKAEYMQVPNPKGFYKQAVKDKDAQLAKDYDDNFSFIFDACKADWSIPVDQVSPNVPADSGAYSWPFIESALGLKKDVNTLKGVPTWSASGNPLYFLWAIRKLVAWLLIKNCGFMQYFDYTMFQVFLPSWTLIPNGDFATKAMWCDWALTVCGLSEADAAQFIADLEQLYALAPALGCPDFKFGKKCDINCLPNMNKQAWFIP